jgi:SAM-dependent methyltransferase
MSSLLSVTRTLGLSKILESRKAKQLAWEEMISVHFVTRCFQTLLNLGLLEEMVQRGTVDVKVFAETNGLDSDLLRAICEALYARRLLRKESDSRYGLEEKGEFMVRNPLSRGWFYLANGYENVLFHLEDLVRKKKKYGADLVRDGRLVGVGSGLASRDIYFPLVLKKLAEASYTRVLDIGCGDGEFLRLLCKRFPGTRAVGVDLSPEAVEAGNEQIRHDDLAGRIHLHVGDALELPAQRDVLKGVDAATTFFVLHEFCGGPGHQKAVRFLRDFRETLPGIPFLIVETVRPSPDEMRRRPGPAIEYFLFHDLSSQRPVGRDVWMQLFREAGFESITEDYIAFARTAIFTIR